MLSSWPVRGSVYLLLFQTLASYLMQVMLARWEGGEVTYTVYSLHQGCKGESNVNLARLSERCPELQHQIAVSGPQDRCLPYIPQGKIYRDRDHYHLGPLRPGRSAW